MTDLERVLDGAKLSETTRKQYKMAVRSYVAYAGTSPSNWTSESLESWLRQLKVSEPAKNCYLAAVKRAARRWAALHRSYCFADAVEGVFVPAQKHPRSPPPLDEEQLGAMMSTCARDDDPVALRDRCLLAIALATGFRRRELAQIEFEDLNARERSIVVIAKRNKRHQLRLSARCWARLDAWLSWLRRRHVASGRVFRWLRRCLDSEMGWCVGPSMRPESIYRIVKRRAKQAGIRMRVCTHSMRHSLAALLRARGAVSEEQIAKRLGHASTSTSELYGGEIVRDASYDDLPT